MAVQPYLSFEGRCDEALKFYEKAAGAKVADFCASIFGWKVDHRPDLDYRIVDTRAEGEMKGIGGGIVKPDREGPWPGMGSFSPFTDPEGRMNGLWRAK